MRPVDPLCAIVLFGLLMSGIALTSAAGHARPFHPGRSRGCPGRSRRHGRYRAHFRPADPGGIRPLSVPRRLAQR